jgi:hypothetical protein
VDKDVNESIIEEKWGQSWAAYVNAIKSHANCVFLSRFSFFLQAFSFFAWRVSRCFAYGACIIGRLTAFVIVKWV